MNTARSRRALAGGATLLALSSLTACGAIGDFVLGSDPFLDQSPRSMAKAAFADMREVTSLRVLGSLEDKDNGFTKVDLRLDDSSCAGTLDMPAGTMRIRKNDKGAWLSLDEDFWRTNAGGSPQADKLVREFADQWSVIGKKDKAILKLCDLDSLLTTFEVDEDDTEDTIEAGEVVLVGDADAVPVTGQDGKERVTAWVSVEAPHRVLKMAPARDEGRPDALYFEEFGADVVVESPAKKDVVTLPRS